MSFALSQQQQPTTTIKLIGSIDLDSLNEPYKLSKWILLLPQYKAHKSIETDDYKCDVDDDYNMESCQILSNFLFTSQICGHHIKHNFDECDFKSILNLIHGQNAAYNYHHFEWIWQIIKQSQSINSKHINEHSLGWIESTWNEYQIIQQHEIETNSCQKKESAVNNVYKNENCKNENYVAHTHTHDKEEAKEDEHFSDFSESDEMFNNLTNMILRANSKVNALITDEEYKHALIEPITSQQSEIANNMTLELYSSDLDTDNCYEPTPKKHTPSTSTQMTKSKSTKTVRFRPPIYYNAVDSDHTEHASSSATDLLQLYVDVMSDANEYSPSPNPSTPPMSPADTAWNDYDVQALLLQIESHENENEEKSESPHSKEDEIQITPILKACNTMPILSSSSQQQSDSVWDVFDIEGLLKNLTDEDDDEEEQEEEHKDECKGIFDNNNYDDDDSKKEMMAMTRGNIKNIRMRRMNSEMTRLRHNHSSHSTSSIRSLPTFKRSAVSNMFKHFNIHHYHGLTKY